MPTIEVTLSDGEPCAVRRLDIFELDGVGPELPGPFRYKIELSNGEVVEEVYDLSARTTPPQHPGIPEDEIVERSPTWYQLLEFETFKAALAWEHNVRLPAIIKHIREISAYIADNCLSPIDKRRIVTQDDWDKVHKAASVPQITREMLAQAFKDHFNATFKEQEIFDAIKRMNEEVGDGSGKVDVLRLWEYQAMERFGFSTEEQWATLTLMERTRKTASIALPKLLESLELNESRKEVEREARKARGS